MKLDPERAELDRLALASALRALRKASGLSGDRLARRCGMSQSKVSRIENGRLVPTAVDVEQILNALQVDPEIRRELVSLTTIANSEYQDTRASVRRGLHHRQREIASLEASATEIRHFLPAMITGLLQTPEYMRVAMNSPVQPSSGADRAIALRLERQVVLHDSTKRFEFLLTESAVRWPLCPPAVMAAQLDHLVSVSRLAGVRLGVLPLTEHTPQGAMHTFVTYDRRLATAELFTGRLVLRDPKDVDHYRSLFEFFSAPALWAGEARRLLRDHASVFRSSR